MFGITRRRRVRGVMAAGYSSVWDWRRALWRQAWRRGHGSWACGREPQGRVAPEAFARMLLRD